MPRKTVLCILCERQQKRRQSEFYLLFSLRRAVCSPCTSARASLSVVVQPLLDLVREYTGYHLALLAGLPYAERKGNKDFDVKVYVIFKSLLLILTNPSLYSIQSGRTVDKGT